IWAAGDEKEFSKYLASEDQDMTAEEIQLYEEYIKAMFVDRNLSMADYAETSLKSGKEVFICVGAVHIVGEGAVAELLKQRGYKVECITG
ncbi:MAG: TraB/GumN family protein, partial [Acutalibacteraceae bacterium]|nr:TraB/GumN family protein [Acutalibacteraceae bacterium]